MSESLASLCVRLELAQSSQNVAMARAAGGEVVWVAGGVGVFLGEGHPLNQALAMGLEAAVSAADLDLVEATLGRGGHPIVLELTPGADEGLSALLAERGYRVRQFQQVWVRELGPADDAKPVAIRLITAAEREVFARTVMAGFLETDELAAIDPSFALPSTRAEGTHCFLAWEGDAPAAAGSVGIWNGTAALSGTSVLPRFRGRGLQRALIAARLAFARERQCELACSATVAWSRSATNLCRSGFVAAYPKIEMERAFAGAARAG